MCLLLMILLQDFLVPFEYRLHGVVDHVGRGREVTGVCDERGCPERANQVRIEPLVGPSEDTILQFSAQSRHCVGVAFSGEKKVMSLVCVGQE